MGKSLLEVLFLFCLSLELLDRGVSSNDFPCLETLCKKIIKEKQPFERLEIKKETLLEMFKVCQSTNTYEKTQESFRLTNIAEVVKSKTTSFSTVQQVQVPHSERESHHSHYYRLQVSLGPVHVKVCII